MVPMIMEEIPLLSEIAAISTVSVLVTVMLGKLHLPTVSGLILSGVLMGPNGLGWVSDVHAIQMIAEVGVVFLLFTIGLGQILFIFLAARFTDYALFFAMLVAMSFVFGQIPITDTILSRYVPDEWRAKALSVKFMVNLTIGATVLPICGVILQSGAPMSSLFAVMSAVAILVALSGLLLPVQADDQRRDMMPAE